MTSQITAYYIVDATECEKKKYGGGKELIAGRTIYATVGWGGLYKEIFGFTNTHMAGNGTSLVF